MDLNIYTTEMSKSVWDKAFFMDKIPGTKCVIDFGCADGAMIRYLAPLFPDITFLGYDINKELIRRAQSAIPFHANVIFTDDFAVIAAFVNGTKKFLSDEVCINFSSVLHEVFSSTGGINKIQELIEMIQPKFITIRDMYCDEPLPVTDVHWWHDNVWDPLPSKESCEFIKTFGPLQDWRDTMHLLMKLQWKDNGWEEELEENYFSWTIDKFIDDIGGKYIIAFDCRYQLPYLSEKWKKEYGWYNPDIHTHAQFILRRDD